MNYLVKTIWFFYYFGYYLIFLNVFLFVIYPFFKGETAASNVIFFIVGALGLYCAFVVNSRRGGLHHFLLSIIIVSSLFFAGIYAMLPLVDLFLKANDIYGTEYAANRLSTFTLIDIFSIEHFRLFVNIEIDYMTMLTNMSFFIVLPFVVGQFFCYRKGKRQAGEKI